MTLWLPESSAGGPAGLNGRDVRSAVHDGFGIQKASCKLAVMTRRTHRNRDAARGSAVRRRVTESDLEWFFDRHMVCQSLWHALANFADIDRETAR